MQQPLLVVVHYEDYNSRELWLLDYQKEKFA